MRRFLILTVVILLGAAAAQLCQGGDFRESETTVYADGGNVRLAGTLTVPAEGQPRAALVLASGSGAQNRDEEVMGHKPFKAIAEYLSARGYAVLRLDDRGVGGSTGDSRMSTSDIMAGDMASALAKLDTLVGREVPKGVLGHSEGGSVAIKTATRCGDCRFIITLAAPAWPGDSIIMAQARAIATGMTGRWDNEGRQRRLVDLVKSQMPGAVLQGMIYAELSKELGEAAKLPQVQTQLQQTAEAMSTPSYRSIVQYDPRRDIGLVGVPWLALNGSKDVQVPPGNLTTIAELNKQAHTVLMPEHNHLFQHCQTGLVDEYASLPEDISEETLKTVLEWLDETIP